MMTFRLINTLSVGFETNYKEGTVLIIGELSNNISSVQISDILSQLKWLKNFYNVLHNDSLDVHIVKTDCRQSLSSSVLYQANTKDFINFISSRASHGMSKYLTIYFTPSLLVNSAENLSSVLSLELKDAILIDMSNFLAKSMEVSVPTIENYDEIYQMHQSGADSDITSGLLRKKRKYSNCCSSCAIM